MLAWRCKKFKAACLPPFIISASCTTRYAVEIDSQAFYPVSWPFHLVEYDIIIKRWRVQVCGDAQCRMDKEHPMAIFVAIFYRSDISIVCAITECLGELCSRRFRMDSPIRHIVTYPSTCVYVCVCCAICIRQRRSHHPRGIDVKIFSKISPGSLVKGQLFFAGTFRVSASESFERSRCYLLAERIRYQV